MKTNFGDVCGLCLGRMEERIGNEHRTKVVLGNEYSDRMQIENRYLFKLHGDETGMSMGTARTTVMEWIGAGIVMVPVLCAGETGRFLRSRFMSDYLNGMKDGVNPFSKQGQR